MDAAAGTVMILAPDMKILRSDRSLRWLVCKPYGTVWELHIPYVSVIYDRSIFPMLLSVCCIH